MELQILIAKYKKFGTFEVAERSSLAKCIIRHILAEDFNRQWDFFMRMFYLPVGWTFDFFVQFRIQRKEFTVIARAISEMFPNEDPATYFVPSLRSVPAKGKLYRAYCSFRALLASANLICRRKKLKPAAKLLNS